MPKVFRYCQIWNIFDLNNFSTNSWAINLPGAVDTSKQKSHLKENDLK